MECWEGRGPKAFDSKYWGGGKGRNGDRRGGEGGSVYVLCTFVLRERVVLWDSVFEQ